MGVLAGWMFWTSSGLASGHMLDVWPIFPQILHMIIRIVWEEVEDAEDCLDPLSHCLEAIFLPVYPWAKTRASLSLTTGAFGFRQRARTGASERWFNNDRHWYGDFGYRSLPKPYWLFRSDLRAAEQSLFATLSLRQPRNSSWTWRLANMRLSSVGAVALEMVHYRASWASFVVRNVGVILMAPTPPWVSRVSTCAQNSW